MTDQVPQAAGQLAARLADAFEQDRGLAEQLTAAQHRLQAANDRLWSGLHPDALGLVYEGFFRTRAVSLRGGGAWPLPTRFREPRVRFSVQATRGGGRFRAVRRVLRR